MSDKPTDKNGNGVNGNGSSAGAFGDFDDFIRDRADEFPGEQTGAGAASDPFAEFGSGPGAGSARRAAADHSVIEALVRLIDGLGGMAGEVLSPDLRKKLESAVRDLLVILREIIDAMIERIDNRRGDELHVEEIPID